MRSFRCLIVFNLGSRIIVIQNPLPASSFFRISISSPLTHSHTMTVAIGGEGPGSVSIVFHSEIRRKQSPAIVIEFSTAGFVSHDGNGSNIAGAAAHRIGQPIFIIRTVRCRTRVHFFNVGFHLCKANCRSKSLRLHCSLAGRGMRRIGIAGAVDFFNQIGYGCTPHVQRTVGFGAVAGSVQGISYRPVVRNNLYPSLQRKHFSLLA